MRPATSKVTHHRGGATLIELSMVMVIIGLLLGWVLAGSNLSHLGIDDLSHMNAFGNDAEAGGEGKTIRDYSAKSAGLPRRGAAPLTVH
jgi:prepilin-type N-terminal cleavage/methylation domain-containing protein